MQSINVLSLFDGISCGRVALERAGIPVAQYYASEILSDAIKIAHKNYPDTVDLGDITKISDETMDALPKIDLLIGGSPCQDLSVYKFDRGECTGLNGEKSGLFYHYLRILKYIKPRFFLLENVPMLKQWEDTISGLLGVKPILINSSLVCAADRKRLYWTNIPGVSQPEDRGIVLADIVQNADEVPQKYWYDKPFTYNGDDEKVQCTLQMKGHRHMKEVYNLKGKCATLTTCNGGNLQKKVYQDGRCRKLTPLEYERLQTLPEGYTEGICDTARYSAIGNGWTVDVIAHILRHIDKDEQKTAEEPTSKTENWAEAESQPATSLVCARTPLDKIPEACEVCKMGRRYGCVGEVYCKILGEYFTGNTKPPYKERPDECPLFEIPTNNTKGANT